MKLCHETIVKKHSVQQVFSKKLLNFEDASDGGLKAKLTLKESKYGNPIFFLSFRTFLYARSKLQNSIVNFTFRCIGSTLYYPRSFNVKAAIVKQQALYWYKSQPFFAVLFKQIFHLKSSQAKIRLSKAWRCCIEKHTPI